MERSYIPRPLSTIRPGDHIIWLSGPGEQFEEVVERYITDGLFDGQRIILLFHLRDPRKALPFLTEQSEFEDAVESGRLLLIPAFDVFLSSGTFRPERCIDAIQSLCEQARVDGFPAVRFLVEMTWVFEAALGAQRISELEGLLFDRLGDANMVWTSHFSQQYFKPSVLLDLLSAYPTMLRGSALYQNIFWLPRQESLAEHRHATILAQSIETLQALGDAEQRLVERSAALKRSESALEMLHSIIDSMGDGVFVTDEQGTMLFCNKTSEMILGYGLIDLPMEERIRLIGNYLPDGVTPYPIGELPIARAIRGESTDNIEYIIRNPTRPKGIWVSVNGRPLRDRTGKIRGGVVVTRDISRQKQEEQAKQLLEEQMFRTQKLESLGVLAGGIAHDLNNLLMGVMGNVDLALLEADSGVRSTERLKQIQLASRRLSDLTHQLLAYSGRGSIGPERVNISTLVHEMADLLRPAISKRARIDFRLAKEIPLIEGDPTQVRQVVMNLITNASDAIGDNTGVITIVTAIRSITAEDLQRAYLGESLPPGEYVVLSITDTGCGMSLETQAKIFEPFFTTKFTGRGLGLAAVLGIVRRHRGALRVTSELGRGTRFEVFLPPASGIASPVRESPESDPRWRGSGVVLLVDDEPTVVDVTGQMLSLSGFEVMIATTAAEALAHFSECPERYTLAILDITMPDMDGIELFRRIREIRQSIPIILSSGYHEIGPGESHVRPNAYLHKPYGQAELTSALRLAIS